MRPQPRVDHAGQGQPRRSAKTPPRLSASMAREVLGVGLEEGAARGAAGVVDQDDRRGRTGRGRRPRRRGDLGRVGDVAGRRSASRRCGPPPRRGAATSRPTMVTWRRPRRARAAMAAPMPAAAAGDQGVLSAQASWPQTCPAWCRRARRGARAGCGAGRYGTRPLSRSCRRGRRRRAASSTGRPGAAGRGRTRSARPAIRIELTWSGS